MLISMFWTDELLRLTWDYNKPFTDTLIASSMNCFRNACVK